MLTNISDFHTITFFRVEMQADQGNIDSDIRRRTAGVKREKVRTTKEFEALYVVVFESTRIGRVFERSTRRKSEIRRCIRRKEWT
jgi:hypothetical protein